MLRPPSLRRLAPLAARGHRRRLSALPFSRLPHSSASIDLGRIPDELDDVAGFSLRLWESVRSLRAEGLAAVFLRVPMVFAHLIPAAGVLGFRFHHAEGEVATLLVLTRYESPRPSD